MALFGILYASMSTISSTETDGVVADLVEVSRSRNAAADVTGCLIFGGGRFAQALEGEKSTVDEIMKSIARDPRHREVTILEEGNITARRFSGWALSYAGPSLFVQRTIARPVTEALRGSPRGISDLLQIMTAFQDEAVKCS